MGISFINPWAEAVLEQMWICCQITGVVAKSIDAELLSDPRALAHHCLHPSEPRWNPLEFHGKRRSTGGRNPLFGEKPIVD
jgi:hypothetical protein